jgi:hypothetical protein
LYRPALSSINRAASPPDIPLRIPTFEYLLNAERTSMLAPPAINKLGIKTNRKYIESKKYIVFTPQICSATRQDADLAH